MNKTLTAKIFMWIAFAVFAVYKLVVYMNEMTPEEMSAEYDSYREAVCVALGMEGF